MLFNESEYFSPVQRIYSSRAKSSKDVFLGESFTARGSEEKAEVVLSDSVNSVGFHANFQFLQVILFIKTEYTPVTKLCTMRGVRWETGEHNSVINAVLDESSVDMRSMSVK